MHFLKYLLLVLFPLNLYAQNDSIITVNLNDFAKDERFDKFQVTVALFLVENDTILTQDFEGLKPAKPVVIKKPQGYQYYAYGYLFFTGSSNNKNPGYVTILVGNPYHKHPHLWVDYNQDFDFTTDPRYVLPYFDEPPLEITLNNASNKEGSIKILLTRNKMFGPKFDLRKYMDEYYAELFKGRKFVGIEYTYREQRLQAKYGVVKFKDDSFKIALFDGNSNGLYNDHDTDKLMVINIKDTVFDSTNPLGMYMLAKPKERMFFEKNGRYFELLKADEAGKFLIVRVTSENPDLGKIKWGKKVPKINFTLAKYKQTLKLKKLRKKNVYIYLANSSSRNFTADTLMLRQIAELDTANLKVICVLYVNKSYQLKIFDMDAEANYYIALGTKEIARKLGISSIPQSLWLCKNRRVIKYGIKPNEFVRTYLKYKKK